MAAQAQREPAGPALPSCCSGARTRHHTPGASGRGAAAHTQVWRSLMCGLCSEGVPNISSPQMGFNR